MVPQGNADVSKETNTAQAEKGSASATKLTGRNTSSVQKPTTSSLSLIRTQLELQDISETAKTVIMASWREGTQKQYHNYLSQWQRFCLQRGIDCFNAEVKQGIDFLAYLFEKGLSYSAINTARSALSLILKSQDGITFGENRLVCRFLKGVFEIKPTIPKYSKIWDVGQVLTYLQSLNLNAEMSLKQLTHKLVMILALLTGQRCQTIHKLNIELMQKLPNKYVFTIGEKLKHTRPGTHQKPIELLGYTDRNLCVVQHLDEYLRRTVTLRCDISQLFVSFIKPHKAVSKDTIGRWIKEVLKDAGIDTKIYSSHSSRAASTSYSFETGAKLTDILQAAGWSNARTFALYYKKPIETRTLGNNIMQAFTAGTGQHQEPDTC